MNDEFGRFEPTVDLVALAMAVEAALEADTYRVASLSVGGELASVGVAGGDEELTQSALDSQRACVTAHARLDPAATPNAGTQQLMVF